ncbi:MAG: AsnC family transcriptional regulator [Phycisphaerae bacterium]|nr:AsnC family transcriptional regulator [Phycisphaerae bacterium]
MDKFDRQILDALQKEFPLSERPYQVIAQKVGRSEAEVWQRVVAMVESGVIRRLGASLDSRKLGYASTLAAVSVGESRVDAAAEVINAYPEVTHCYQRKDTFNIWFTVIAYREQRILDILEEIRAALHLEHGQVLNVPVQRLFKLDARFTVSKDQPDS